MATRLMHLLAKERVVDMQREAGHERLGRAPASSGRRLHRIGLARVRRTFSALVRRLGLRSLPRLRIGVRQAASKSAERSRSGAAGADGAASRSLALEPWVWQTPGQTRATETTRR